MNMVGKLSIVLSIPQVVLKEHTHEPNEALQEIVRLAGISDIALTSTPIAVQVPVLVWPVMPEPLHAWFLENSENYTNRALPGAPIYYSVLVELNEILEKILRPGEEWEQMARAAWLLPTMETGDYPVDILPELARTHEALKRVLYHNYHSHQFWFTFTTY